MNHKHLFIDAEWFIGGEVFLIGYAHNTKKSGQLYDESLSKNSFMRLLKGVKYIYCYGPDVGVLETFFQINLRKNFICVNLLTVFRRHIRLISYKLANVEKYFGIIRTENEYKKNIFKIWIDWLKQDKKNRILKYNREDVVNMFKLWKIIQLKYNIKPAYLIENKLK